MPTANPNTAQLLTPTLADLLSPQDPKKKLLLAQALQGTDTSPVQHWTQGLARMANAAMGNYGLYQDDQEAQAREGKIAAGLANDPMLGGSGIPAAVAPQQTGNSVPKLLAALFGGGGQQPTPALSDGAPAGPIPQSPPGPVSGPVALPNVPATTRPGPDVPSHPRWYGTKEAEAADMYEPRSPAPPMAPGRPSPLPPAGNSRMVAALGAPPPVAATGDPARDAAFAIGKSQLAQAMAQQPVAAAPPPPVPQGVAAPPPAPAPAAAPVLGASPQAGRMINAPPPEEAAHIRRLLADPATRALGMQRMQKYAVPKDQFRPLDPAERAARGISPEDKTPYQINDATNEMKSGSGTAQTNVTVNQQRETAFAGEAGQIAAKGYGKLVEEGRSARQLGSDIQVLRDLGPLIQTGKWAEVKAAIGPYAEAAGIKIDKLPEIQAYEAVVNRIAPSMRVQGSGATSDFEMAKFLKSLPNLGNTPEGNEMIGRTMEGLTQTKIAGANIASRALAGEITQSEAEKQLRNLPDPLKEWRAAIKQNPEMAKPPSAGSSTGAPAVGTIQKGYRFKGGDPSSPSSWEKQ